MRSSNRPGRSAARAVLGPGLAGTLVATAGVLVVLLTVGRLQPAVAGWTTQTRWSSAGLSVATVGQDLVGLDGGKTTTTPAGASRWSDASVVALGGGTKQSRVELPSTSSVPVTMTGTVLVGSVASVGSATFAVCSKAWTTTCPGTTLVSTAVVPGQETAWSVPAVAAGTTLHLRLTYSLQAVSTLAITALAVPRAPADRTTA